MNVINPRKLDQAPESWSGECKNILAMRWPDFVEYSSRLATEAPLLRNLLDRYGPQVLDAGMGIGCESVFLAQQGAQVTGNEVSPRFRELARIYARTGGVDIKVTAIDWRNLGKVFNEASFDIVLVLGNSLCLLREAEDRLQAVMNFKAVCRPGGVVVVDERNFEYMISDREAILKGNFKYSGRVMYCGTKVQGYPVAIESDRIRFVYEDLVTKSILGELDMHPFRLGELVALIENNGFMLAESYSDLNPTFDSNADFYTHVFQRV